MLILHLFTKYENCGAFLTFLSPALNKSKETQLGQRPVHTTFAGNARTFYYNKEHFIANIYIYLQIQICYCKYLLYFATRF